jgi:hypothetical protein
VPIAEICDRRIANYARRRVAAVATLDARLADETDKQA